MKLTGLFTHGVFQTVLDWECKRFARQGASFTLGLIDIDGFSCFNRTNGHAKGDQLLQDIALMIKNAIREVDLCARQAGDVFALLLLGADLDQASVAADRIRQAVTEKHGAQITLSMGLASFPQDAFHKTALIDKAQEALLQAKRMGKNRVHFFARQQNPARYGRSSILVVDDEPIGAPGEAPPGNGFSTHVFGAVQFLFVVAPDHPLATLPEPLAPEQIMQYRAIAAADSSRNLPPRTSGLISGQDVFTLPGLRPKLEAHAAGLGVGSLPALLARAAVAEGRLVVKQVLEPQPDARMCIAWRTAHSGRALAWFLERMKDPALAQVLLACPAAGRFLTRHDAGVR